MLNDISYYINQCGLEGLERQGNNYNFRCPFCNDSKKSKRKKRGWFYYSSSYNIYFFKCYNSAKCPSQMSFNSYLKQEHTEVYNEYLRDSFKENGITSRKRKRPKKQQNKPVKPTKQYQSLDLKKISELNDDHLAYKYIKNRMIPKKFFNCFYYTENYRKWINTKINNKFKNITECDKRIVIPFYTMDKKIFSVAGRSLEKNPFIRYITVKFDETHKKVYGLDRVDFDKTIYITEGQFDSLFIPNGIAMGGADIDYKYLLTLAPKKNYVFVYDNEINKDLKNTINKAIDNGFKVCIFPREFRKYGKDINQMIESGFSKEAIFKSIKENIYSGMIARLKLIGSQKRF